LLGGLGEADTLYRVGQKNAHGFQCNNFVYSQPIFIIFDLAQTLTRKLSYRKDDRAMRPMYGHPENFQESLTTPTATCPEFLMGFCSD